MKNYKEKQRTIKEIASIVCDVCKKEFSVNNILEYQEMNSIEFTGSYGSVFGDGDKFELDICQHCLKEKLGKYFKLVCS